VAILTLMVVIGLASLFSFQAKGKTLERTYQRDIGPEIERALKHAQVERASFDSLADQVLSERAALRRFITPPDHPGPIDSQTIG
jgi:hypothetical protein